MHLNNDINYLQYSKQYVARVLLAVMLLLLTAQFLHDRFHQHALSEAIADCASCSFVHQLSADLPPNPPALKSFFHLTGYLILALVVPQQSMPETSFLLPLAHAPPHHTTLQ